MNRRQLLLAPTGLLLPGLAVATAADTPHPGAGTPLPLDAFAALPRLQGLALSPDGQRLAGLLNLGDDTLVFSRALAGGGTPQAVLKTDNRQFRLRWLHWVGPQRLVLSVAYPDKRGFVDTTETRLLAVNADGSGLRVLVEHLSVKGRAASTQLQDRVVDWLPGDGAHILLQLPDPSGGLPAVWRVNVFSGERSLVHPPERRLGSWMTDVQHRVRLGLGWYDDETVTVQLRAPEGGAWRELWRFQPGDVQQVQPLGFDADSQRLWVLADHQGRQALFQVDLASPTLERRLVLSSPTHDIDGSLLRHPATGAVLGLRTAGDNQAMPGDGGRAELFDPRLRGLAAALDAALPQRYNRLLQLSQDARRCLVYSSGNALPGAYWLADLDSAPGATLQLRLLGETRPQLPPERLAGKAETQIQARDGTALTLYLTRPAAPADAGPLPLVLLPHGGPHSSDDDDFDVLTELLASRGWAVLQVNFRGSDGRGHAFRAAGWQRWGLEMQDDLNDALQWAIARGIADARRVCIVGGSYGGYAALMGAVKTPQLFRAVVSVNGVSDLLDLWQEAGDYVGGVQAMRRMLGELWGDRARLVATSPARQAAQIQAPVLLVHGTADRVVPVAHSRRMAAALRALGKPHRLLEIDGAGHALDRRGDQLQWLQALLDFLAPHQQLPAPPA